MVKSWHNLHLVLTTVRVTSSQKRNQRIRKTENKSSVNHQFQPGLTISPCKHLSRANLVPSSRSGLKMNLPALSLFCHSWESGRLGRKPIQPPSGGGGEFWDRNARCGQCWEQGTSLVLTRTQLWVITSPLPPPSALALWGIEMSGQLPLTLFLAVKWEC